MKHILLIIMVAITTVHAQNDSLSLHEAIQIGLNLSNEMLISNSDTIIADANLNKASSNLLPKLSIGANINHLSHMPVQINLPFPTSPNNDALDALYLNATLEQPLFTGFKLSSIKNSANYNKNVKLLLNKKDKNLKVLEIQKAYWNYFKSLKMIEILNDNLKLITLQRKNVSNFMKMGMATRNDLLKTIVAQFQVKSKLIDAENNSKLLRANFNRVVGLNLDDNRTIRSENLSLIKTDFDYDSLLTEALVSRAEILANNLAKKAAEENISIAKSDWYPQISANASYNYLKLNGASLVSNNAADFWWIGLGMKWNIWDWGKTSSNVRIAEESCFQIDVSTKLLKKKIELEVYKNYLNIKSLRSKIEMNKVEVKSAEENYNIVNNKFNSQMATPTEISEATALLAEAKIRLINSLIDFKIAELELKNSIGRELF